MLIIYIFKILKIYFLVQLFMSLKQMTERQDTKTTDVHCIDVSLKQNFKILNLTMKLQP